MKTLTEEEYTALYKTCKKLNRDFLWSLRKMAAFLLSVAFILGLAAYSYYPHPAWKMPAAMSGTFIFLLLFFVIFFMPTVWLKRKVKNFPDITYQELQSELDSYL